MNTNSVGKAGGRKAILSKLFCFPSKKGSTLKGKNLLSVRANSFLLESTHLRMESHVQIKQSGSHKAVSLSGNGGKSFNLLYPVPFQTAMTVILVRKFSYFIMKMYV